MRGIFLSTPSARRATTSCAARTSNTSDFYPRPPRGGRPVIVIKHLTADHFYPRPPRGGRPTTPKIGGDASLFLSTPSARRATKRQQRIRTTSSNFYPRPPRGGRLTLILPISFFWIFLSTPSARRATGQRYRPRPDGRYFYPRPPRGGRRGRACFSGYGLYISIHALREEGDYID